MKILTLTTLYPNSVQQNHGIFVENRIRHLVTNTEVQTLVVAPVPWFPFKNSIFGQYAKFARVPKQEVRNGIKILHPRYLLIPKVGMTIAPILMALALIRTIRKIMSDGYDFDVIDAHYFYPDGVAATLLSKLFKKPVVITARGTDLNLIPKYKLPRAMIQWEAKQSAAMITVCQALKDTLIELGTKEEKVTVLRNGVDLEKFSPPVDRESLRSKLNIKSDALLSVGHLITRKGHDIVIKALADIPDMILFIAGSGPERATLAQLADDLGLENRVIFLGEISPSQLCEYYGAVDALVLASSREGWANVLLEAMACGTPAIATKVWGTPEVIKAPEAGRIVNERNSTELAGEIKKLFTNKPDRNKTRSYAEKFSWDDTTMGQVELFKRVSLENMASS